MRSLLFNIAFWLISIFYTLLAAIAALTPGRWFGLPRPAAFTGAGLGAIAMAIVAVLVWPGVLAGHRPPSGLGRGPRWTEPAGGA